MRLFLVIAFFICLSCDNEKNIEKRLEQYSKDFIRRKKIDVNGYKKEFFTTRGKDYTHYYLVYYKIIDKDSSIVYFMRNESGEYFIQANEYFDKHILGILEKD